MCFSTEASFTAALVLGGIGWMTTKTSPSKPLYFLASIPFLFALQQLSEGIIWYHFSYHEVPQQLFKMAVNFYLIFAFLIWPVWIPFAMLTAENVLWRRRVILAATILGCGLAALNLFYAMNTEIGVQIVNHSIQYTGNAPSQALIYPLIILIPCFISSLKNMHQFGLLIAGGYLIANYYYQTNFVSVWCFFSAVVSLIIYKILRDNQTDQAKNLSL